MADRVTKLHVEERVEAGRLLDPEADLDERIQRTRGGRTLSFVRWQAMATVVLHGVQHRAEIAEYLTAAGYSPGDLDFIFYIASRTPAS